MVLGPFVVPDVIANIKTSVPLTEECLDIAVANGSI